jgi:hypothetical protein
MTKILTITAVLKTPIITLGYFTFDGLLAGIIFDKRNDGDVEAAHAAVPIVCDDGLFHASAARFKGASFGRASFSAGLRATHDLDPDMILKGKDGTKLHRTLGLKRMREFGMVKNDYRTIIADRIEWDVEGDPQGIADVLEDVFWIGKRRAAGYGEVANWDMRYSASDGLVSPSGEAMRPIPATRFKGNLTQPLMDAAWKPAYWAFENRSACFVPSTAWRFPKSDGQVIDEHI